MTGQLTPEQIAELERLLEAWRDEKRRGVREEIRGRLDAALRNAAPALIAAWERAEAAERERDALLAEADWLESQKYFEVGMNVMGQVCRELRVKVDGTPKRFFGATLRDAIDAARKERP